ncbi:MAG: type III pantothenate kinase [Fibrobacter sp.]|nr:type III pantothenate kinase [Fibrobacter sp.]
MNTDVKSKFTLAIDIGNTRTHFGVVDMENLECIAVRNIETNTFRDQLVSTVIEIFERYDRSYCAQIVISSVIKKLTGIAKSKLDELFPGNVTIASYTPELPFKISYRKPETLGTDRLANALFAFSAFNGADAILVSAGTAVTIDVLQNATFRGGAILPGIRTQFSSLNQNTDALPLLDTIADHVIEYPGLSTDECIRAGVILGISGAMNKIISEFKRSESNSFRIVCTGGDWDIISKYVDFEFTTITDMTMIGTALFVNCC